MLSCDVDDCFVFFFVLRTFLLTAQSPRIVLLAFYSRSRRDRWLTMPFVFSSFAYAKALSRRETCLSASRWHRRIPRSMCLSGFLLARSHITRHRPRRSRNTSLSLDIFAIVLHIQPGNAIVSRVLFMTMHMLKSLYSTMMCGGTICCPNVYLILPRRIVAREI